MQALDPPEPACVDLVALRAPAQVKMTTGKEVVQTPQEEVQRMVGAILKVGVRW